MRGRKRPAVAPPVITPNGPKRAIAIRLAPALIKRLDAAARRAGVTRTRLITQLVSWGLDAMGT